MRENELAWLLDSEWTPTEVIHYTSKEMSHNAFDDYQAMLYGYQSYNDMIASSNKKHHDHVNRYGDKYIQGWVK